MIVTNSIGGLLIALSLTAISEIAQANGCANTTGKNELTARPEIKYHQTRGKDRADKDLVSYEYNTYSKAEVGSTIKFNQSGGLDAWFLCNHTSPSKWTSNVDYINKAVEIVAYSIRESTNYSDPTTFRYISVMRVTLGADEAHSLVLHCEEVECPQNRQPLILTTDLGSQSGFARILSPEQETNSSEVKKFDTERAKVENRDSNETCPYMLTMLFDTTTKHIKYKWSLTSSLTTPVTVKSAMGLENAFRFTRELNRECVNYTEDDLEALNITCSDCEQISASLHARRPISFFNDYEGIKRVFKVYFDLRSNLYFSGSGLEPTDPKNQVALKVEKQLYRGEPISVKCHEMMAKFSYGFVAFWSIAGDSEPREINYLNDDNSDIGHVGNIITETYFHPKKKYLDDYDITDIEITCFAPVWNSEEWVSRTLTRGLRFSESPSIMINNIDDEVNATSNLYENHTIIVVRRGESVTFNCTATGIPLPTSLHFVPSTNFTYDTPILLDENDPLVLIIKIDKATEFVKGIHKCTAKSRIGYVDKYFEIQLEDEAGGFHTVYIYALTGLGIVLLIFAIVSAVLLAKYRREKIEFTRATEEAIKRFQDGFIGKTSIDFNSNHEYKDFEVPLVNWGMGGTMLGSGAFGVVQKGFIQRGRSKTIVAIKTVNAPKEVEDFESSLMELTIMSYIGHHEHVVSLVASCTDNLRRRSLLIGVEYCAHGDLLSYVHKRKSIFHNYVNDKGYVSLDKISHTYDDSYTNMITTGSFSTMDLYRWSYQIAHGMEFLASKKVLHADLAARNILLTDDNTAKISDFGLSRQLMESDSYTKKTNVPLPWRWMSLEALRFRKFSCQSDVWSYGVLLFELFSLGEIPWPGLGWTHEFSDELEKGRRLARPLYGTETMYEKVMLECWRNEPSERITFEECRQFFETSLAKLNSTEGKDDDYVVTC